MAGYTVSREELTVPLVGTGDDARILDVPIACMRPGAREGRRIATHEEQEAIDAGQWALDSVFAFELQGNGLVWVGTGGAENDETTDAWRLTEESTAILEAVSREVRLRLGRASMEVVRADWERALHWAQRNHQPSKGPYDRFARALLWTKLTEFSRQHQGLRLYREWRDDRARTKAAKDQDALAEYLAASKQMVKRLQTAFPKRCHVPGMTPEDVAAELNLQLLEHVRSGRPWAPYERVATEATFVFLSSCTRALKKRRQVFLLADPQDLPDLVDVAPTPEAIAEANERTKLAREALAAVPGDLTARQRTWLEGFAEHVSRHGTLNEAEVARTLGRSRSSATRAKEHIASVLRRKTDPSLLE